MTDELITKFNMLFPLMMPGILDGVTPDIEQDATEEDDSLAEEFKLKIPCDLSDLLDIIEDKTDFMLVYIAKRKDVSDGITHVCAITNATEGHLNKLNFCADPDGKVHSIVATLYESQEIFGSETLRDLKQHIEQQFFFEYKISDVGLQELIW